MRKTARPVVWEGGRAQSPSPDPIKCRVLHGGLCDAMPGRWGDFWWGDKFWLCFGLRGGRKILCRNQVDHLAAPGEAAELEVDTGIGQRQEGVAELPGEDLRVWAERQELVQFGGGAAPAGRALEECANGVD